MLKLILIVTTCAPDLGAMEGAYTEFLNYAVVDRGQVPQALAAAWDAPRMANRDYVLLQPESEANIYLRFVQSDAIDGYDAMETFGWNATEILVKDPDELARTFTRGMRNMEGKKCETWLRRGVDIVKRPLDFWASAIGAHRETKRLRTPFQEKATLGACRS